MACKSCDYLGYLESFIMWGGRSRCAIKPCPDCNDTRAYSRRVQEVNGFEPDDDPEPPKSAA